MSVLQTDLLARLLELRHDTGHAFHQWWGEQGQTAFAEWHKTWDSGD